VKPGSFYAKNRVHSDLSDVAGINTKQRPPLFLESKCTTSESQDPARFVGIEGLDAAFKLDHFET
jgi:hypothetical protein